MTLIGKRGDVYTSHEEFHANESTEEIMHHPGIVKACAGTKIINGIDTGEPCIVIGVLEKKPLEKIPPEYLIPSQISGIPTDIIEVSAIHPIGGNFAPFNTKYRPVRAGASAAINAEGGCTIGAIVRDSTDGKICALTCNHCCGLKHDPAGANPTDYSGYVAIPEGTNYIQPSRLDGGTVDQNTCGVVKRAVPMIFNTGTNQVDAAIAELTIEALPGNIGINNVPFTFASKADYEIGETIYKTGRTTGYTTFGVLGKNVTLTLYYGDTFSYATVTNTIECDMGQYPNESISAGDSGSGGFILRDGEYKLIGLLFASNSGFGGSMWLIPIETIVSQLQIEAWDGSIVVSHNTSPYLTSNRHVYGSPADTTFSVTTTNAVNYSSQVSAETDIALPKFWVGGTGNWTETTHWSMSSGGTGGAALPTQLDNVLFDANSGLAGGTVTFDSAINCKDLTFASSLSFTVTGSNEINVYGSLILESSMTWSCTGLINFRSTNTGNTFTSAGKVMHSLNFAGPDGYWTLQDNLTFNDGSTLNLFGGTFDTGNKNISAYSTYFNFQEEASYFSRGMVLGSSTIDMGGDSISRDHGRWYIAAQGSDTSSSPYREDGINFTMDAGTSTIKCQQFHGGGKTYHNVEITGYATSYTIPITGSSTYNNLTIATSNSKGCGYQLFGAQTINGDLSIVGGSQNQSRIFINCEFLDNPNVGAFITLGTVTITNVDFTGISHIPKFTTIDSNLASKSSGYYVIGPLGDTTNNHYLLSQTITASQSYTIYSIAFDLSNSGSPSDGLRCTIRTGSPEGTEVGTSDEVLASTLNTSSEVTSRFIFSTPVSLTSGSTYYFTLYRTGSADASNYYLVSFTAGDTYAGGRMYIKNYSGAGSWTEFDATNAGKDLRFSTLKEDVGPDWTGTSIGDGGKNTRITFTSPTTRYWVGNGGNWYDTAHWSASSGGSGGATLPLIHDTVIFDSSSFSSSSQTVTVDTYAPLFKDIDCSGVTHNPSFTFTSPSFIFGSITLGTLTMTGTGQMNFYVLDNRTITSNGAAFTMPIEFFSISGKSVTLQDDFVSSNSIVVSSGIFDANNKNISVLSYEVLSESSTTKMGSGTWTLTGSGTIWVPRGTITSGTSTIKITDATASQKSINGNGYVYNNIWLTGNGSGAFAFNGSHYFNDFKVDTPPHTIIVRDNRAINVQTFTVAGTAGNLITINSLASSSHSFSQKSVVDYYPTAKDTAFYNEPGVNNYDGIGQSFTPPSTVTLGGAGFYLYKFGSPTGNVYVDIYAHSGTFGSSGIPTGSALATSDALDITGFHTYLEVHDFSFSGANQISLTGGTHYIAVVRYTNGDNSNALGLSLDFTYETHPGNLVVHTSGGSWAAQVYDMVFYIYGVYSSTISSDYLNLSHSHVLGDTWYAGTHSVNTVDNSGWTFTGPP